MNRALALVLVALVLAGCNRADPADEQAAPTPAGPPPPPPPPSVGSIEAQPNDTWRYQRGANESAEEITARVVSVTNTTIRLRTTTTSLADNTTTATVSTLERDTLALIELEDGRMGIRLRFDPPLPIVIPAEDHTYRGNVTVPTFLGDVVQPASGNVSFLGGENVTVPAGTFYAYRYDASFQTQGAFAYEQRIEMWFAPEVHQAVRTITDGRAQELVSYSRGDT